LNARVFLLREGFRSIERQLLKNEVLHSHTVETGAQEIASMMLAVSLALMQLPAWPEQRTEELEARLSQISSNSYRHPTGNGPCQSQPKSLRTTSTRAFGGSPGHDGWTLQRVAHPDQAQIHRLESCPCCHSAGLSAGTGSSVGSGVF